MGPSDVGVPLVHPTFRSAALTPPRSTTFIPFLINLLENLPPPRSSTLTLLSVSPHFLFSGLGISKIDPYGENETANLIKLLKLLDFARAMSHGVPM